jgi:hypothetical protein
MNEIASYSKEEQTDKMPFLRRGNWDSFPRGMYTITEAARLLGITRESLSKNYGGENAPKRLPRGFRFIRDGRRAVMLERFE